MVSGALSPSMDMFLQDVAQMAGGITYGDIIEFGKVAQPHHLRALNLVKADWDEAAVSEDEEAIQEAGAHVASILKSALQSKVPAPMILEEPTMEDVPDDSILEEDYDVRPVTNAFLDYIVGTGVCEEESPAYRIIRNLAIYMSEEDMVDFCNTYGYNVGSTTLDEALLMEAPFTGKAKNIFGKKKNAGAELDKSFAKGLKAGNKAYNKLANQAMKLVSDEIKGKGESKDYLYWPDSSKGLSWSEWIDFVEENKNDPKGRAKIYNAIVTDSSGRRIVRRGCEDFSKSPIAASTSNKKLKYVWEGDMVIGAEEAAKKPGMTAEEAPAEKAPTKADKDDETTSSASEEGEMDLDLDADGDGEISEEEAAAAEGEGGGEGGEEGDKKDPENKPAAPTDATEKAAGYKLPQGVTYKHVAMFKKLLWLGANFELYDAFNKKVSITKLQDLNKINGETIYDYTIKAQGKSMELVKWLQNAVRAKALKESMTKSEAIKFQRMLAEAVIYPTKSSGKYLTEAFKPVSSTVSDGDVSLDDAFFTAYR